MDRLAAQVRLPAFPPFHYCRTSSDYPDSQPKDEGTVITGYRNRASAPLFLKGQFLGKSSQAVLVKSILEWKPDDQSRGDADEPGPERRERMWDVLVQRLGKFQVQAVRSASFRILVKLLTNHLVGRRDSFTSSNAALQLLIPGPGPDERTY